MRLSADTDDAGYDAWQQSMAEGRTAIIKLDGIVMSDVVTADSGVGLVVRTARDAEGRIKVDGHNIVTEQLHGKVEITFDGANGAPGPSADRG